MYRAPGFKPPGPGSFVRKSLVTDSPFLVCSECFICLVLFPSSWMLNSPFVSVHGKLKDKQMSIQERKGGRHKERVRDGARVF